MTKTTIKANRVGINFGWEAHVKQGRVTLATTGTHATKEAAIEAAKDLAARKGSDGTHVANPHAW